MSSFAWMLIYKAVNLWWKIVSVFCRKRRYLTYAQWWWPLYTGSASLPNSWVLKLWVSYARILLIGGTFAYTYNMPYTCSSYICITLLFFSFIQLFFFFFVVILYGGWGVSYLLSKKKKCPDRKLKRLLKKKKANMFRRQEKTQDYM